MLMGSEKRDFGLSLVVEGMGSDREKMQALVESVPFQSIFSDVPFSFPWPLLGLSSWL